MEVNREILYSSPKPPIFQPLHIRKRCVLFVQFTGTICCWFEVTGSHDMEDTEKNAFILYKYIYAR